MIDRNLIMIFQTSFLIEFIPVRCLTRIIIRIKPTYSSSWASTYLASSWRERGTTKVNPQIIMDNNLLYLMKHIKIVFQGLAMSRMPTLKKCRWRRILIRTFIGLIVTDFFILRFFFLKFLDPNSGSHFLCGKNINIFLKLNSYCQSHWLSCQGRSRKSSYIQIEYITHEYCAVFWKCLSHEH